MSNPEFINYIDWKKHRLRKGQPKDCYRFVQNIGHLRPDKSKFPSHISLSDGVSPLPSTGFDVCFRLEIFEYGVKKWKRGKGFTPG